MNASFFYNYNCAPGMQRVKFECSILLLQSLKIGIKGLTICELIRLGKLLGVKPVWLNSGHPVLIADTGSRWVASNVH